MTTTVLAYIPSPSQGVWYVGPFPIRAYALFIIVGIVAALLIGDRRWTARGGERGVIYDISLWAVPFGLIGGRLYHVMTDWPKYFSDGGAGVIGALRIWDGGLGIWGAVALGGVGAWIACRRRGIPLPAFGDAIAPGIVLAQAIGRLGNYFNQELYGRPTTVPWGLEIYERKNSAGVVSPDLANGVSTGQLNSIVHPTFLYELLWNLLIFAVLIWVDRKFKIGHGRLFALYVAGYCLGRFWVELLRSDQATLIADIRVNSFTSTFVFIGAVVYIMVAPKGREDPESLKGYAFDEDEESPIDELAKELTAVGAAAGVVAAAKVAGESEDEDAEAVGDVAPSEAEVGEVDAVGGVGAVEGDETVESEDNAAEAHEAAVGGQAEAEDLAEEAAAEADVAEAEAEEAQATDTDAEELGAEVAGVPADSVEEAEEFAAEGEEPAADVAAEDGDTESEPEESTDEPEPVGGVGAVEGDEAVEAEDNAAEAHEAAVEGEAKAEELAADVAAEEEDAETEATTDSSDEPEPEAVSDDSADEVGPEIEDSGEPSESVASTDEPDAVGGVGAVEGDDAVEAKDNAAEAHESEVEGEAKAEELADAVASDADDEQPEGDDTAEAADEQESETDAPSTKPSETDAPSAKPAATPLQATAPADEGRIRRWLRRRNG